MQRREAVSESHNRLFSSLSCHVYPVGEKLERQIKGGKMTSLSNFKGGKLIENYPNYLPDHIVYLIGG